MEWLNVDGGRPIFLAAINLDRTGLAQLDGDDPGRRIGTKEDRVLVEFHGSQPKWRDARRRVPKINGPDSADALPENRPTDCADSRRSKN